MVLPLVTQTIGVICSVLLFYEVCGMSFMTSPPSQRNDDLVILKSCEGKEKAEEKVKCVGLQCVNKEEGSK